LLKERGGILFDLANETKLEYRVHGPIDSAGRDDKVPWFVLA
jgi:hypothetical protein